MIRVSAKLVTEVNTFETVDEVVSWIESGSEVRAIIGDILYRIVMARNGLCGVPVGNADDEAKVIEVGRGDIEDLLDAEAIIGISRDGDTDGDYSQFGVLM